MNRKTFSKKIEGTLKEVEENNLVTSVFFLRFEIEFCRDMFSLNLFFQKRKSNDDFPFIINFGFELVFYESEYSTEKEKEEILKQIRIKTVQEIDRLHQSYVSWVAQYSMTPILEADNILFR